MDENYNIPVARDALLFTVEMALFKAQRLWPKKYVPGDHDRLKPVARAWSIWSCAPCAASGAPSQHPGPVLHATAERRVGK
ncbi:MAG: hypothetical protein OXP75_03550 [Rhodospirillales bacterium]|nr:hypothetical protein [Rhodospirillales bacterium]